MQAQSRNSAPLRYRNDHWIKVSDGKLNRNWLKVALGDELHALLCAAGHNVRQIS
jgi:hypothetical protein